MNYGEVDRIMRGVRMRKVEGVERRGDFIKGRVRGSPINPSASASCWTMNEVKLRCWTESSQTPIK
jgi:hypothetical protein